MKVIHPFFGVHTTNDSLRTKKSFVTILLRLFYFYILALVLTEGPLAKV